MTEKLKVLDLFSGIGGFSLGLERTGGFETVAFCEIEAPARFLLNHHWPGVKIYDDIKTAKFNEPVDVVTAGFPCQDISNAGLRAGLSGSNSGLFWYILRAVRMVGRPQLILENVAALLNRGMGTVLGALASVGYNAEWDCIQARDVGAPHRRDRVFIIADPQWDNKSWEKPRCWKIGRMGWEPQPIPWDAGWEAALASFRGMDDGISRSVDRTDGLRNTVVPQIITQLGHII